MTIAKPSLKLKNLLQFFLLIITFTLFTPQSHANINSDFSQPYGLIVHNLNKDRAVPRIKALSVLLDYFSVQTQPTAESIVINFEDIERNSSTFDDITKACQVKLFDCSAKWFYANRDVTQKEILTWFYKLKTKSGQDFLKTKYPRIQDDHLRAWVEARRFNLLSGHDITYQFFQDLLYRNKVVEANLNQPYTKGLIISAKDITVDNYHSPHDIKALKDNLGKINNFLQNKGVLTSKEQIYLANTKQGLQAAYKLEESLADNPYILRQYPDLSENVVKAIRTYGLQEVLYAHSYDYSENANYRQHNLTTGIKKMDGKVVMPGEVMDYWKMLLAGNGLKGFRYGWVIDGGKEVWQFGGGICGSSTSVFIASWKAGLEIVERRNHTKYYGYLYPVKDIGLDSTVYRPSPNLKIKNNTNHPLVYSVYDDKEKKVITISVISNRNYKSVKLEGPIYTGRRSVKWIRHFEDFDGNIRSETLHSRYDTIYK